MEQASPTSPTSLSSAHVFSDEDPVHKLGAAAILVHRHVEELEELIELRKKGWTESDLNNHFKTTRRIADEQNDRQTQYWYKAMKPVMSELDDAARFIPTFGNFEFLDIGCSPGGFSARVLEKNRYASGVGISLPPSMGGYEFSLERRLQLRQRYRLIEQDIMTYDLHMTDAGTAQPFPKDLCARFALVILDGHALRTYSAPGDTPDDPRLAQAVYRDALLIGQFIIGLLAVRMGGTVVVKLSHLECSPAAHLVYLLDAISDTLVLHKPAIMHSNRGTFYAVAKGVGHGQHADMKDVYLDGLRDLWRELRLNQSGLISVSYFAEEFILLGDFLWSLRGRWHVEADMTRSPWTGHLPGILKVKKRPCITPAAC
ncbi:uncharacterized protein TRAVEDRAFT_20749 [Trametes versicolor FP-101664 SS1]|uniref:uncharacterized protein n=1 Tax=Trametes versicolor (strain FP-101664) TaxID=717944 RepID=UPI0004621AE7|nr:uncharacterized protein TRAVEDRAFT_20749 [Trametes versicolor FP-101664 SS1]EIW58880.1 hypothetical protein TRAVEDRAFT_20749 [Trametes versicolor FP-101664 SS1]